MNSLEKGSMMDAQSHGAPSAAMGSAMGAPMSGSFVGGSYGGGSSSLIAGMGLNKPQQMVMEVIMNVNDENGAHKDHIRNSLNGKVSEKQINDILDHIRNSLNG